MAEGEDMRYAPETLARWAKCQACFASGVTLASCCAVPSLVKDIWQTRNQRKPFALCLDIPLSRHARSKCADFLEQADTESR